MPSSKNENEEMSAVSDHSNHPRPQVTNGVENFKIPQRHEQLADEPAAQNQFWVREKTNLNNHQEDRILQEIQRVGQRICGSGSKCLEIISNDYFDILYSVVYYLEDQTLKVRKELIQCMQIGLKNVKKYIEQRRMSEYAEQNFLSSSMVANQDSIDQQFKIILLIQNSIKAYVYLVSWFMSDNSKIKDNKEIGAKRRKKKDKDNDPGELEISAIMMAQKECLRLFISLLDSNIHNFWPDHKIDEEFVELFLRTGFDMLQNTTNIKNSDMKQMLFDLLQKCMQNYGNELKYMLNQNTTKIINLLYTQENLAKPLAEFVGIVAERQDNQLANEIIRDLTKEIFHNDSQHETIGIKNVAKFVSKLSKFAPKAVYLNIGNLLGFFDCEAYLLRQALIKILSNIIQRVLSQDSNENENTARIFAQTKIKFLELLIKRFLDKSSYCRVKVMKVFVKLTEENLVPRHMYLNLFSNVIGRFKDQTVLVRKGSLKLFQQMFIIFGLIFNVSIKEGERFLQKDQIANELLEADKDLSETTQNLKQINEHLESVKKRIQSRYQCDEEATLQAHLDQDRDYQTFFTKMKESQDAFNKADFIKSTYTDYQLFIVGVEDGLKLLIMMLSSKSTQDTIEAIKVFKLLQQYGVENSHQGIRKMLTLVFSKDDSVQNAVVETYEQLFFDRSLSSSQKTKNLLHLMRDATLTDVTCIEELLKKFIQKDIFEKDVYKQLWFSYAKIFENRFQNTQGISMDEQRRQIYEARLEQRSAIQLIRMMGTSKPKIIQDHKKVLLESSMKFAEFDQPDFIIMKEAIIVFEKLVLIQAEPITMNEEQKLYLFKIISVIINKFGTHDLEWFCASETILNTLFNIKSRNSHEYAKLFIEQLVRKLYLLPQNERQSNFHPESMADTEGNITSAEGLPLRSDLSEIHYAQLFFAVGHVAVKMLTYIEQMENDLKKAVTETYQNKKDRESDDDEEQKENDLAQITGGKDAEIEQYTQMLTNITEEKLIQDGLLGKFLGPILNIAHAAKGRYTVKGADQIRNLQQQAPEICILERSAILALCKFMCVSSKICMQNLDLIFQILDSRIDFGVKANIIISLGDLFNRFPNNLNERTDDIFKLLHDEQNHVRRQALMVITHLVLNDMLKLKGQIVDICMLLEDPDEKIKDQVKLFLHELHSKGHHIIYNLFPNAISRLSQEFPHLNDEEFQNISKNLLNYINKEKQMESIVEKMCNKLKHNVSKHDAIEWRNTAYCLTQIKYSEKTFTKLLDNYECWKERMIDSPDVHEKFNQILAFIKKTSITKEKIDEFDAKINTDESNQHLIKKKESKKKSMNRQQIQKEQEQIIQQQKEQGSKKRSMQMMQKQDAIVEQLSRQDALQAQLERQAMTTQNDRNSVAFGSKAPAAQQNQAPMEGGPPTMASVGRRQGNRRRAPVGTARQQYVESSDEEMQDQEEAVYEIESDD